MKTQHEAARASSVNSERPITSENTDRISQVERSDYFKLKTTPMELEEKQSTWHNVRHAAEELSSFVRSVPALPADPTCADEPWIEATSMQHGYQPPQKKLLFVAALGQEKRTTSASPISEK